MADSENSTRSNETIVEVRGVSKYYGDLLALSGATLKIRHGEIVALLGPNGAGKTTMMKILTGYMEPSAGEVKIDGMDLQENKIGVQAVLGYLPENAPIYGDMLVQEYLQLVGDLRGIPENLLNERLSDAVLNTGIKDVLVRPIRELSKGFRQRVGLAQAILHRPKLLILDEPTNGLDPTQIVEMRGLIKKLARDSTVLLSTHILSEAAATCGRAIIISKGQIKADANLDELSQSSEVVVTLQGASHGKDILQALEKIAGVKQAQEEPEDVPGYLSFRLYGEGRDASGRNLAHEIFNHAKKAGWEVCELRPQTKTLENVFKELV